MTTVRIRLRNPEGTTQDGRMFIADGVLEWHEVLYMPLSACEHLETMCRECIDVWEEDWEIDIDTIEDLDSGAAEADADEFEDDEDETAGQYEYDPCLVCDGDGCESCDYAGEQRLGGPAYRPSPFPPPGLASRETGSAAPDQRHDAARRRGR